MACPFLAWLRSLSSWLHVLVLWDAFDHESSALSLGKTFLVIFAYLTCFPCDHSGHVITALIRAADLMTGFFCDNSAEVYNGRSEILDGLEHGDFPFWARVGVWPDKKRATTCEGNGSVETPGVAYI